jgi:hypothetical protein
MLGLRFQNYAGGSAGRILAFGPDLTTHGRSIMLIRSWFAQLQLAQTFQRLERKWRRSPRRTRESQFSIPAQVLEVRTLLSAALPYATAANVSQLVADIAAANKAGGTNTITLTVNTTFDLTAINNTTNGANGLPVIGGKQAVNLTIIGNSDTIERSTAAGMPAFRLLDVAKGSSLTLDFVTLQNGLAQGSGAAADGGAVYNQGTLTLSGAIVVGNTAQGADGKTGKAGADAAGGGIWSNGSITVENAAISNNSAVGGNSGIKISYSAPGGNAFGGGLDIAGGTANITNTTFGFYLGAVSGSVLGGGNMALGGLGNSGGSAYGGAVYVAGGTVTISADQTVPMANSSAGIENIARGGGIGSGAGIGYGGFLYAAGGTVNLTNDIVTQNWAGDPESQDGPIPGYGGGIFIAPSATVYLDSFTVANAIDNADISSASDGSTANIDGKYILLL